MKVDQMTINCDGGMHTRPGAIFVKTCKQFSSTVQVENKGKTVNGKSLIKLMSANICQGDTITVTIDGPDEMEAITELKLVVKTLS